MRQYKKRRVENLQDRERRLAKMREYSRKRYAMEKAHEPREKDSSILNTGNLDLLK